MNRDELRQAQAPLKQRYRDDPEAALVTLKAVGTLGEGMTCSVETGRALAVAGLHPATGGDGLALCSGDMLLQALAASRALAFAGEDQAEIMLQASLNRVVQSQRQDAGGRLLRHDAALK